MAKKVRAVEPLAGLSVAELREYYRGLRSQSRLDDACFDSVVIYGIEQGDWRSLGYPIDLPVKRGDRRPLAMCVAARTLAAFTYGPKTGPIAAPAYRGKAAR